MKLKIILFFFLVSFLYSYTQKDTRNEVIKIKENSFTFSSFSFDKNIIVDLSNYNVYQDLIENPKKYRDVYSTFYYNYDSIKFKLLLLKKGYISIIDKKKATISEIENESIAKKKEIGIHKKIRKPRSLKEKLNSFFEEYAGLIKLFTFIFGTGLIYRLTLKPLYIKFIKTKRINLLIVGDPAVGKTALFNFFKNYDNEWEITGTTSLVENLNKKKMIKNGYILDADVIDIAGSKVGRIIDRILSRKNNKALIIVLSPTKAYQNTNEKLRSILSPELQYINEQYGSIRYLIGSLQAKANKRKPKIVILFISKFDLYSEYQPSDNIEIEKQIKELFKEHIEYAEKQCRDSKIEFHCIIGSSKRKWNVRQIEDKIFNRVLH